MKVKLLNRVRLVGTPWTAAYQTPPSMGFSRQEYWSGVPLPSQDWMFPIGSGTIIIIIIVKLYNYTVLLYLSQEKPALCLLSRHLFYGLEPF